MSMKKNIAIVSILLLLAAGIIEFDKLNGYDLFSENQDSMVSGVVSAPSASSASDTIASTSNVTEADNLNHDQTTSSTQDNTKLTPLDYSTSTSVVSSSTPDIQWLTYTNRKLGFSIDYPKGVDITPYDGIIGFGDASGQEPWFSAVNIHQDNESIDQFFKSASLKVSLPDKLAMDDRLLIDHEPAMIFHESGSEADINRTAVVSHDNRLFEIDINSYYDTTTKIILDSFRFLK